MVYTTLADGSDDESTFARLVDSAGLPVAGAQGQVVINLHVRRGRVPYTHLRYKSVAYRRESEQGDGVWIYRAMRNLRKKNMVQNEDGIHYEYD